MTEMGFLPWKRQYYLAIFLSIRPCKKGMEDDDGLIQVPEKHALQREQEQVRAIPGTELQYRSKF